MGLGASCEGLCAPCPAETGAAGVLLSTHLHLSESSHLLSCLLSHLYLGPSCLGVVFSISGTTPSAAPKGEGEGGSLQVLCNALSSQAVRGRGKQHVAWAALHPKFRAVEVPTPGDQLELGLLLVKPFTGAAGGRGDWFLPIDDDLAGQMRRAWARRGSPQPLLPSLCMCVGSSSPPRCQEVSFLVQLFQGRS